MAVSARGRRALKWAGAALAALVVVVALAVSALRVVVPQVPAYRGEVAAWAGRLLGAPVDIGDMDLQWRRLRPELILGDVRYVSADARHAFAAREVRIGISVRALLHGSVAPARIVLVEPDMTLDFQAVGSGDGAGWRRAFADREHRGEVYVERGRVTLLAEEGRRRVDFTGVDAELSSDGVGHRFNVTARPAGSADGVVRAALRARGWPGRRDWQVDGRAEFRAVDLVALQRLGRRGRLESGRLDLTLDVHVSGLVQRVSADFGLAALSWQAADGVRGVDRAAGEAEWTDRPGGWDAALRDFTVVRAAGVRENGPATVAHARATADAAARWHAAAEAVHVDDLALLAEALPWEPLEGVDALLLRSPRGVLEDVRLDLELPPDGSARYAASARASGLGIDADAGRIPGFDDVAVTFTADERGGRAQLAVAGGGFELPRVFRGRIPIDTLTAALHWQRADDGWTVHASRIDAANADAVAGGDGRLHWPADGRPSLELAVGFSDVSLAAHARYLPVSIMSDNLVAWLDRAVAGGTAQAGAFRYDGELGGGALRDGRAALAAEFDADGIALDYADGWPAFSGGRAHVRFTGIGFGASVDRGAVAGVAVPRAEVSIEAFAEPVLELDADSSAPFGAMLDAFRTTPVGDARWLDGVRAEGAAGLALQLALPLREPDGARVRGRIALTDATVAFRGFPHPMTGIRGALEFTEDGVSAQRVDGLLLGMDTATHVATLRDGDGAARAVEVTVDGDADRAALAALFDYAELPVRGRTRWQARVLAPYDAGNAPYLEIESTLEGLAISLPSPLGKEAGQSRPLAVHAELRDGARRFSVDGGDAIRAAGMMVADDGRWRIARARVHLGSGDAADIPDEGIALTGRLGAWRHGVGDGVPHLGVALPFTAVDLHVDALEAFGRALDAVHVVGRRGASGWRWALDGERLAGTLMVPDAATNDTPVVADFARMALPVRTGRADAAADGRVDARAVTPIVFHVGEFTLGPAALGEVNGRLRRVENGVALEGFSAATRDLRIAGDASWHTVDGFHRTTVRATVDTTDMRRALDALGYAAAVDASAGHLQADLDWLGSPFADPRAVLNGTVSVRVERGTLFELQPGAGRVFGLLSLSALPRRLALDFSDVFRRGLAFDSIAGTFRIERGDAYTDDLRLQGPAARVEVRGRTGLATRDYDQEAVVVASLASSLAIAGTIAGGPGVGAAMLIASELLKGPLEGISRVRYRVTGPWEQPAVERVLEPARGPQ